MTGDLLGKLMPQTGVYERLRVTIELTCPSLKHFSIFCSRFLLAKYQFTAAGHSYICVVYMCKILNNKYFDRNNFYYFLLLITCHSLFK